MWAVSAVAVDKAETTIGKDVDGHRANDRASTHLFLEEGLF